MKTIGLFLAIFLTGIYSYGLNPSKNYAHTPDEYGMTYDTISIRTTDGLILKGWYFKATQASSYKIMIISNDGEGNMADNIELVTSFLTLGYNVLTYDYRGFGKSADFTIDTTFFIYAQFQKDIEAALAYVKKYQAKMKIIHLYGKGIGAGLSLAVGANHIEVGKIIADSPYSNFEEMSTIIKEVRGTEPKLPLGYNKNFIEPTYALAAKGSTLVGILFISGEDEKIFTTKIAKKLSNIRGSISSTYTVKGATAATTYSTNKTKYFAEIKSFLK